jgi:hypothetical protein
MTTQITSGSVWESNGKKFMVIHVVELDGHTWVHYRENIMNKATSDCKEYSCYLESFISRFNKTPD